MEVEVTIFQPDYVEKFQCNGQFCNARCCKGWGIYIDKESMERYKNVESDAKEITSNIKYIEERDVHYVTLDEKRHCPFLNAENLCSLQLKYGEEFLSSTCHTYPRQFNKIDAILERALSLTCPVAANLVLLASTPIQFKFVDETSDISRLAIGFCTPPLRLSRHSSRYNLWRLEFYRSGR